MDLDEDVVAVLVEAWVLVSGVVLLPGLAQDWEEKACPGVVITSVARDCHRTSHRQEHAPGTDLSPLR